MRQSRCVWLCLALASVLPGQRSVPIDNAQVRVLDVTSPPHRKSGMHEHAINRVMIYLTPGTNRLVYEDGRIKNIQFQPGDALWDAAGGRHTSENPADSSFRVVEVELKDSGKPYTPPRLDPVRLAPGSYRVVMDNPQVRVLRVRIDGRQKIPMHEHALNRVVVYLNDQRVRVTGEDGQVSEAEAKAGEVRWAGTARHAEENLLDQPFEVVVVELK